MDLVIEGAHPSDHLFLGVFQIKTDVINKFDLKWQVFRVNLKSLKTFEEKTEAVVEFLKANPTRGTKARVLNYLEGLSMAYRDSDRAFILSIKKELESFPVSESIDFVPNNYEKFTRTELHKLAKDLFIRTKKWLLKGYRHEDQISFLKGLLIYLKDKSQLEDLQFLIDYSLEIPNTHKFFF